MSVLAVVPARSGSKGLTYKNALTINRESLTMRALRYAKKVTPFVILTSDLNSVMEDASYGGYMVHYPIDFYNGVRIHSDECRAWDVWRECVHWYEGIATGEHFKKNKPDWPEQFDYHLYLEPTSPCRTKSDLGQAITLMRDEGEEMVFSVSTMPGCPQKALIVDSDGHVAAGLSEDLNNPPRQIFPTAYKRNGAFYGCTDAYLKKQTSIITKGISYAELLFGTYVNIDNEADLHMARDVLKHND